MSCPPAASASCASSTAPRPPESPHICGQAAALDDPRDRGRPLSGRLAGLWRYRVGDYRVIADIDDGRLVVVAVRIAHRSDVHDD